MPNCSPPPLGLTLTEGQPAYTYLTIWGFRPNGDFMRYSEPSTSTTPDIADPLKIGKQTRMSKKRKAVFYSEQEDGEFTGSEVIRVNLGPTSHAQSTESVSTIAEGSVTKLHAIDEDRVLILYGTGLLQYARNQFFPDPFGGGGFYLWQRSTVDTNCTAFDVVDDTLYFADSAAGSLRIRSRLLTNLGTDVATHASVSASGSITQLAAGEAGMVFFQINGGPSPSAIIRSSPTLLAGQDLTASLSYEAKDLFRIGDWLYWMKGSSSSIIAKLPVNAEGVTRDLSISSMEIIQSVQTVDNDVTLVADKPTFARVIVDFDSSSADESEIRIPYGQVLLEGVDEFGADLPGSPLAANYGPAPASVRKGGQRRDEADECYFFQLPASWTCAGEYTFRAIVNPGRVIRESNYDNNRELHLFHFRPKSPTFLFIHPLSTTAGTLGHRYEPWMEYYFDRALTTLPTPDIIPVVRDTRVLEQWRGPFRWAPYPLFSGRGAAGITAFTINVKLSSRWFFTRDPALANDLNSTVIHTAMVPRHHDWGIGGQALSFGHCMVFRPRPDHGNRPYGTPRGGVTLAHEIGHSYGVGHAPPAPTDGGGYPYGESFSDGRGHGFDPISGSLIIPGSPDQVADVMAYYSRKWASDYNWNRLANGSGQIGIPDIPEDALDKKKGDSKGGDKAPGDKFMIIGFYDPSGVSEISSIMPMDAAAQARAQSFISANPMGTDFWEVAAFDSSNSPLWTRPVSRAEGGESGEGEEGWGFMAMADSVDNVATIQLRRRKSGTITDTGGHIIGGGHPPSITITSPTSGQTLSGSTMTVNWSATDPDKDQELSYLVRYSFDGGNTWMALAEERDTNSVTLSTEQLPGGASCYVEVTASDGILSDTDTAGPFTIPEKAPEIYLFAATSSGRSCEIFNEIHAELGESIQIRARTLDPEDGGVSEIDWVVTGPTPSTATGNIIDLTDLRPGRHTVTATATDSDGQTATASIIVNVDRKYFPNATGEIILDGHAGDPGYEADHYPIPLRYSNAPEAAFIHTAYADGYLYAVFTGMILGTNDNQFAALVIDTDGKQPAQWKLPRYRRSPLSGELAGAAHISHRKWHSGLCRAGSAGRLRSRHLLPGRYLDGGDENRRRSPGRMERAGCPHPRRPLSPQLFRQ